MSKAPSIAVVNSIHDITDEEFGRLVPTADPFISRSFIGAIELHGAAGPRLGWTPNHLIARDDKQQLVGLMPLYVKTNSFGEFIYDWSWARAFEQTGLPYYPKLFTGIPYTPATGPRLWIAPSDSDRIGTALIAGAIDLAKEHGLSSWHVAFPAEEEQALFSSAGMLLRQDVQYHWLNRGYRDFDDFLAGFSSDKRRKLRADRRKVASAGINISVLHGDEIPSELWQDIHALYATTFDKFGNYPALSAACLADIGRSLGNRMVIFVAWRALQPVAVSICFHNNQTLYGRYWGCAERIDGLHFELCYYQGIEYCLSRGLQTFEPGAGGEHKITRGFEPVKVSTMHWIANPDFRELLRKHLERSSEALDQYAIEAAEHLPFSNPSNTN